MNKLCRLLRTYPQFSEDFVLRKIPGAKTWVYYNWAFSNDPWIQLGGVTPKGDGYIGMEVQDLMRVAREVLSKNNGSQIHT